MTQVVVTGHGGYASAVKRNLSMLIGQPEGMHFVDFDLQDDLETLKVNLMHVLQETGQDDVLFVCDLAGGSPFREAAFLCTTCDRYAVVAGINTSAFTEITFNRQLSARQLAQLAADVTVQSVLVYPTE